MNWYKKISFSNYFSHPNKLVAKLW